MTTEVGTCQPYINNIEENVCEVKKVMYSFCPFKRFPWDYVYTTQLAVSARGVSDGVN